MTKKKQETSHYAALSDAIREWFHQKGRDCSSFADARECGEALGISHRYVWRVMRLYPDKNRVPVKKQRIIEWFDKHNNGIYCHSLVTMCALDCECAESYVRSVMG
jgi:NADH:ubiquinone oxidoreductase subunit E